MLAERLDTGSPATRHARPARYASTEGAFSPARMKYNDWSTLFWRRDLSRLALSSTRGCFSPTALDLSTIATGRANWMSLYFVLSLDWSRTI